LAGASFPKRTESCTSKDVYWVFPQDIIVCCIV
jgi:hypothetical protein